MPLIKNIYSYFFTSKNLGKVVEFDGTLATSTVNSKYIVTEMCDIVEMMERGVVPGQILHVKHKSSDLISFMIDGSQFAIRLDTAKCIKVNKIW